jgi:hypothetical protein
MGRTSTGAVAGMVGQTEKLDVVLIDAWLALRDEVSVCPAGNRGSLNQLQRIVPLVALANGHLTRWRPFRRHAVKRPLPASRA